MIILGTQRRLGGDRLVERRIKRLIDRIDDFETRGGERLPQLALDQLSAEYHGRGIDRRRSGPELLVADVRTFYRDLGYRDLGP